MLTTGATAEDIDLVCMLPQIILLSQVDLDRIRQPRECQNISRRTALGAQNTRLKPCFINYDGWCTKCINLKESAHPLPHTIPKHKREAFHKQTTCKNSIVLQIASGVSVGRCKRSQDGSCNCTTEDLPRFYMHCKIMAAILTFCTTMDPPEIACRKCWVD